MLWQYWGSTHTHSPIILKLQGPAIPAVSAIPVLGAVLPLSAFLFHLLIFTFLRISLFPWAWLFIPLAGTEKDNFVDHYCVITVISINCFSIHAFCWKDAQRASGSTASVTPAGRLLLTQAHVHAQAHTHTALAVLSLCSCPSSSTKAAGISPPAGFLRCAFLLNALPNFLSLGVNLMVCIEQQHFVHQMVN